MNQKDLDQRVSIGRNHTVQTTPLTLLTVPTGYAFEVRYLQIVNNTNQNKNVTLYWTDSSKSTDIYLIRDERIDRASNNESVYAKPDISLVMYEGDSLHFVNESNNPDSSILVTGILFIPEYQIDFD